MNTQNKERLLEQLGNGFEGQKFALLIGNGFNKYQFTHNGLHSYDYCDWEAVLKRIAEAMKLTEQVSKDSELKKEIDRVVDMQSIDLPERGILLFDLMRENELPGKNIEEVLKDTIKDLTIPSGKGYFKTCRLLDLAWENGHHILTTNYDTNLENYFKAVQDVTIRRCKMIGDFTKKRASKQSKLDGMKSSSKKEKCLWRQHRYQWNIYYGKCDAHSLDTLDHDIWHVHGNLIKQAISSVLLTSEDYCDAISHFRQISGNLFKKEWKGTFSWLKLFMECPLVIVGLNLDACESFLRHLLMIRKKYRRMKGLEEASSPSYFLYSLQEKAANDTTKASEPKNPFLELLGFENLAFDTYDDMYDLIC